MQTTIIRNFIANTAYTLPQQYTNVLPGNITVSGNAGENTLSISCASGVDYLISILYRSNTGVAFPKVHIALIDGVNIELVSMVSYAILSNTELRVNIGKSLENNHVNIDLNTIQIDAQYSNIQINNPNEVTGIFSFLDKSKSVGVPIDNFSLPNMAAGGLPMIIIPSNEIAVVITGGGGDRTSKDPNPPALKLTWDKISNALYTDVADYNAVFGSDFTTLTVDGNDQLLSGNSTSVALNGIFHQNTNLLGIEDTASSISSVTMEAFIDCTALTSVSLPACTTLGGGAFKNCTALVSVSLPACTYLGDETFVSCTSLTSVNIPLCEDLGSSVLNDGVFEYISGQTITLTIAASRATCNGKNPDGDIVYLVSNNTATIIYV